MTVYMSERCGAWQIGDDARTGAIQFRIFLPSGTDPHITAIRVAGDFQGQLGGTDWDFDTGVALVRDTTDPRGDFWTGQTSAVLPAGFYEYKYFVEFSGGATRIVTDPCARYGGLSNQNSGVVIGGIGIGLIEILTAVYVSSVYKDAICIAILIIFLIAFPRGLLGEAVKERG